MSQLRLLESGPIYRNPNPGYTHHIALFSHVVDLGDGQLLCAYNRGQAMYATDLTFFQARSPDGGVTWGEHTVLYDRAADDRPFSYHSPFMTRLRDGRLVIAAFRVDRSDPELPLFNEKTGGLAPVEVILQRSSDQGRTWSPPEVVAVPDGMVITPSSASVELADGAWFLAYDVWHAFDDPGPYRPRTVGYFSRDDGRDWGEPVTFADGAAAGKGYWHGRVTTLDDGRLFALFWSADMRAGLDPLPLHRCIGSPDGRRWTAPEATNLPGQTNGVVDMGGGLLAAVYTSREPPRPGFRVALSTDLGRTWDLDGQQLVWDATGRERLGVNAPESYPRSHDTIAFGAPTANRLSDGTLLVTFWCTELSITHIRYARLRAEA